jgi:streptomycin 6-kinase
VVPVVLHGDLQHFNVLNSGEGWRAIDPHGWFGDPAFEAAALVANPRGLVEGGDARGMDGRDLASRARRRTGIYAEATGYDVDRLRAWGFVGCVIAELWMIESHDLVHGAPLAVAETLLEQGI